MSEGAFHYGQPRLENDLVALEPFDPTIHTARFVEELKCYPDLLQYVAIPEFDTTEDFIAFHDKAVATSPGECLYVIFDKTRANEAVNSDDNYAGLASLNSTDPVAAITELGLIIFPAFQRTHVSTNSIGLLLKWTLDPPPAGGLGLRRVEWKTHSGNAASRKTALRMGFEFEGVARWQRVFPNEQVGLPVDALEKRNGTTGEVRGRHTATYSIVWDEWDEKRPKVVALMEKKY